MEFFKLNDSFTLCVDYDVDKQEWIESVIDAKRNEVASRSDDVSNLLGLAEACLLCLVKDEFDYEGVFCEHAVSIMINDEGKRVVTIQTSEEVHDQVIDEYVYNVDVIYADKDFLLGLYDFFKKSSVMNYTKEFWNIIKKSRGNEDGNV